MNSDTGGADASAKRVIVMSSGQEELRAELTKRGVPFRSYSVKLYDVTMEVGTVYSGNGIDWVAIENPDTHRISVSNFKDEMTPAQAIAATLGQTVTGETSDGYHTFNDLYHHRAVLFSVIVRDHDDLAWKSKMHHDGTMYDGMFIVGIETPQGQATYHYDIDPYWEMFDCKELERAPEWDGHTPDQAIERIATLGNETCSITDNGPWGYPYVCSACGASFDADVNGGDFNYCPNCRARVVDWRWTHDSEVL